jgi:hypothetical protein
MTVTGHGLKSVCFERERTPDGTLDVKYTGRILKISPYSGGQIELRLSASDFMLLAVAVDQVRQGLVHTQKGWRNTDDCEPDAQHCGCPLAGPHGVECPTMLGDIARLEAGK